MNNVARLAGLAVVGFACAAILFAPGSEADSEPERLAALTATEELVAKEDAELEANLEAIRQHPSLVGMDTDGSTPQPVVIRPGRHDQQQHHHH